MIQKLVNNNCKTLFKYPLIYLFLLLSLTTIASYFYVTLPTETSLEALLFEKDVDLLFYEKLKDQFGDNVSLVVGFSAPDVFAPDALEFIAEQTTKLEQLTNVERVVSLSNVEQIIGSDNDFIVQNLLQKIPANQHEQKIIRSQAQESSLIRGSIVSADSQATLFLIIPTSDVNSPASDEQLVGQVKNIFAEAQKQWPQFKPRYAGGIQTRLSLTQSTNRDMLVFMPLTYLFLIILIFAILRNPWLVLVAISNVSLCLVWTLATLNLIGGSMGPMTSILPPLTMALAVSDSIHVFTEFLRQDRISSQPQEAMRKALKSLAVPCFLTSLTTAIGFLSLAVSDVPPIRHLGLASSVGMMLEFFLSMTVLPLGIYLLRNKKSLHKMAQPDSIRFHAPLHKLGVLLPRYHRWVLSGSVVLIILSLSATFLLKVETNLLEFFKKSSPTYQDALFVDQYLGGTEILEVSIRSHTPDRLLAPEVLQSIEKLEVFLKQQEIVSHVSSINDFFREMNKAFHNNDPQWFKVPDRQDLAAQYLLLYDGRDLENILDPARQWTHVAARLNVHSSKKIKTLIENLELFLHEEIKIAGVDFRLSGQAQIANNLIDYIIDSQVESLALALGLIFIVMLKIFRSIKMGLISIIPNILPILFNFALMGIVGIPLNSATAIIAAVAIGIAVDDTIHFIHAYQQQKNLKQSTEVSVQSVLVQKGMPLISTSLILAGGFGILIFGSFIPTIQFGILVSLIMIFAILSDLIILPCLLLKFDR